MTRVRIAVLMTCFNRRALTLRCLASLARQPGFHTADLFLFDFYLWLNDDVELAADTLALLVADADAVAPRGDPVIVAAATTDPASDEISYGAHHTPNAARPLRMELIRPMGTPQPVDTISGNIVLVSAAAEARLGNMSPVFQHIYGDLDYGFRARRDGIPVVLASRVGGTCAVNGVAGSSLDPALSRFARLRLRLREERRIHARDWRRFVRAHGGGWPMVGVYTLAPYLHILFDRPHGAGN